MSQPFNKEQLSYLQQLMTNRNKSLRHEVSDHLDNALPVKKLKGGDPGQVATTDANGNVEWGTAGGGVSDHGALTGLGDDDHPQYHNDARGDARYYTQTQIDTMFGSYLTTASAAATYLTIAAAADLPGTYVASMYAANSGSPTHTSASEWQKVGSGGGTLTWTSEIDKRPSGVSAQVDTSTNKRIDIRKTGLYQVSWSVQFSSIKDAKRYASAVYKNGTQATQAIATSGVATTVSAVGSRVLSLTSGDYLELYAFQSDSSIEAYEVTGGPSAIYVQAAYLGAAT